MFNSVPQEQYDLIVGEITSPMFRNPIKNFIDQNCGSFIDVDENTFEQGALFNEFTQLIENLLSDLLTKHNLSETTFAQIAEQGLQHQTHYKYFKQLISFGDYNYFKSLMTKRNYQLIKQLECYMREKESSAKANKIQQNNSEDQDLDKAIKVSLQLADKMRRMKIIEEEELKRAIKLSQLESTQKQQKQNPAPVKQNNNPVQQKQNQPKAGQQISNVQKEKPINNKVDNKPKVTMSFASNPDKAIQNKQPNQQTKIESANKGYSSEFMIPKNASLDIPLPANHNISGSSINNQSQSINESLISNDSLNNSKNVPTIGLTNSNIIPTICVSSSNGFPMHLQGKKAKLAPIDPKKKGNVNQTQQLRENTSNQKEIPKQQFQVETPSLEKSESPISKEKELEINSDKLFEEVGKQVSNQTTVKAKEIKTDLDLLLDDDKEPQEEKEGLKYASNEIKFYGFNPDIKQKERKYYEELLKKEKEQQKIISQLEECRDDLIKQKMEDRKKKEDEFIKKNP